MESMNLLFLLSKALSSGQLQEGERFVENAVQRSKT